MNLNVNYRRKVTMICPCSFIHTKKIFNVGSPIVTNVPLCWGELIVREALHVWGEGVDEK